MAQERSGTTSGPMPLSLRRNISWTFAGNVVYAGCQWAILMALAKMGMPEMVGQFTLGLAISAPIFMFANLQLRAIQATDARRQFRFGDYFALRLVTTGLALLVVAAIALMGGYPRETASVILAIGAAKAFEAISDVVCGLLQQRERMDRIALLQIINGPVSLAAMGTALYVTGSVAWAAAALAASWALRLFSYDLPSASWAHGGEGDDSIRPRWDAPKLARLVCLALPLGIVMMLISLNTNIPRYFIEHHLGERELGIFAAMAYLIVVGNTVVAALGQSASPRLARYHAAGDSRSFRRLVVRLVAIAAALGVAGSLTAVVVGRPLLAIVYGPAYAEHSRVFSCLMVGAGFWYVASILGYAATARRRIRHQTPVLIVVLAVTFVSCQLLVARHGLLGAAYASLLSAATCAACYFALLYAPEA